MMVHTEIRDFEFSGGAPALFERLTAGRDHVLMLESADSGGAEGRRSFLFTECAARIESRSRAVFLDPLGPQGFEAVSFLAEALAGRAVVERGAERAVLTFSDRDAANADDHARLRLPSPLDVLRAACFGFVEEGGEKNHLKIPGVFGYDLADQFEELPAPRDDLNDFPDFVFWLPKTVVVVDHRAGRATLIDHCYGRENIERCRESADEPAKTLSAVIDDCPAEDRESGFALDETAPVPPGRDEQVDIDDADFAQLVTRLKAHIAAGDVFQIVPSRTFRAPCADPMAAYKVLRAINPSPYMFFIRAPEFSLFGASPETCVRVRGNPKIVSIRPIAGTRPRGRTAQGEPDEETDSRLEAELKLDAKEIAEHMMLVDLARNDVARVCRAGTRRVARLLDVERYSHVMHLVSSVEGELCDELDALHAYAATANMGTVVGAPKIEAARLLRRYERDKRGPYGGAVGYITSSGELDTAIVIRAAFVRNGTAFVRAGAGVVFDSDPLFEAAETRLKAAAVLQAIRHADGGCR